MRIVPAVIALVVTLTLACLEAAAQSVTGPSPQALANMKADYKRPPPRAVDNAALVDLGRYLFFDPRVSASAKTACVSCHFPNLGWAVTDLRSRNDSGKMTSRRSQPLIGLGHVTDDVRFGWDGRNASLEAQAKNSVATGSMSMRETDTPVNMDVIELRIRRIPEYVDKFEKALPGQPVTIDTIAKAIAAYERTIEPGPAPFDRWIEGDESAISGAAKRGFVIFNDKANCVACHSGWRFTDDRFHDIGTTTTDLGRGRDLKDDPLMKYAFKTPTLRSVAMRAPYMHNGSVATLDDAVAHYVKGGIDRPSRSPLMMPLQLSDLERQDLVAFMQTLTGFPEGEPAPALPGGGMSRM
jgi:cytochrome c peroxidase